MTKFSGFVSIANCGSGLPITLVNLRGSGNNDSDRRSSNASNVTETSSVNAFSGKGVKVGGSIELNKDEYQDLSQNNNQ